MWWWWLLACAGPDDSLAARCGGLGDVHTVAEVVERVEALPEATIACTLASLDRPLQVMAVASSLSVQPGSWRSPRLFVFTEGLNLAAATEGEAMELLEMGEWVEPGRTLKAELVFPLDGEVDPYSHLEYDGASSCGACHLDEEAEGPEGAYVSAILEPSVSSMVPLDEVIDEAARCDPLEEPMRCAILSAVVGEGDIEQGTMFEPE